MDKAIITASLTSVAGRYGRSLFVIAKGKKELKTISADFQCISDLFQSDLDLKGLLLARSFSKKLLISLWEITSDYLELSALFLQFVRVLIQEKRLDLWDEIAHVYRLLSNRYHNDLDLVILSAKTLSESDRHDLEKGLLRIFHENLSFHYRIDASLLSGFIVQSDTIMLDASLKTQLTHLTNVLRGRE